VTNRQYIAFLDDLVSQGREEEALRHAPRERGGTTGEQGAMIYGRDRDGHFVLRPDADGDVWLPDQPVVMVNWACAMAYVRWLSERERLPWRLPAELEWEKAARGADGRFYPWGDWLDPSWACMVASHERRPVPVVVDRFPVDTSPYEVRGLAGNSVDWCADPWASEGPPLDGRRLAAMGRSDHLEPAVAHDRVVRGGGWHFMASSLRCALRRAHAVGLSDACLGIRPARSTPS
jgi:serine/threonine-protein kinase